MLSLSNSRPEPAVQACTKWCAKNKQGTPAQSRQASAAFPLPARKEKKRKDYAETDAGVNLMRSQVLYRAAQILCLLLT